MSATIPQEKDTKSPPTSPKTPTSQKSNDESITPPGTPKNNGTTLEPNRAKEFPTMAPKTNLYRHALDVTGRETIVHKKNGDVYEGILEKFTPTLAVSLAQAVKEKSGDDVEQDEQGVVHDVTLKRDEIVSLSCFIPKKKNFRTDREYNETELDENRELEEWQPDPEIPLARGEEGTENGGWSVDEMFRANDRLGVQSTFNGIEQYCTAEPEGDEEARRRAEQIAAEIERGSDSHRYSQLENDDEERDLDKETVFDPDSRGQGGRRTSGYYAGRGGFRGQYNGPGIRTFANIAGTRGSNFTNSRYGYANRVPRPNNSNTGGTSGGRAPMTAWRQEAQSSGAPSHSSYSPKSPSLHSTPDERHQSSSPASHRHVETTPSGNGTRRTSSSNSGKPMSTSRSDTAHHEQQQSPPQQPSQSVQTPEVQPIITPIPKQPVSASSSVEPLSEEGEKPKKKFSFNPNAKEFVPKIINSPRPTPTSMPSGAYAPVSMIPIPPQLIPGIQQNQLIMSQQPNFSQLQHQQAQTQLQAAVALQQQQHLHQQQLQHQQFQQQMIQQQRLQQQQPISQVGSMPPQMTGPLQQSQANISFVNHTGIVAGSHPYQPGMPPPIVPQQQILYQQPMVYGYTSQVAPTM